MKTMQYTDQQRRFYADATNGCPPKPTNSCRRTTPKPPKPPLTTRQAPTPNPACPRENSNSSPHSTSNK
jgi:hypothetical protein